MSKIALSDQRHALDADHGLFAESGCHQPDRIPLHSKPRAASSGQKRWLFFISMIVLGCSGFGAGRGIIVYSEYGNEVLSIIEFETISWKTGETGTFKKPNGQTDSFQNGSVRRIVYFDRAYFQQLDASASQRPMRDWIRSKEVVVDANPTNLRNANDADRVVQDVAALESLKKKLPICAKRLDAVSIALHQLVERYRRGERKQAGHWLTPTELAKQKQDVAQVAQSLPISQPFSFTTKGGKFYEDCVVSSVATDGFSVITSVGAGHVAFADLPDDISNFPTDVRSAVQTTRDAASSESAAQRIIAKEKEDQVARQRTDEVEARAQEARVIETKRQAESERIAELEAARLTENEKVRVAERQGRFTNARQAEEAHERALKEKKNNETNPKGAVEKQMQNQKAFPRDRPRETWVTTHFVVSIVLPLLISAVSILAFKTRLHSNRKLVAMASWLVAPTRKAAAVVTASCVVVALAMIAISRLQDRQDSVTDAPVAHVSEPKPEHSITSDPGRSFPGESDTPKQVGTERGVYTVPENGNLVVKGLYVGMSAEDAVKVITMLGGGRITLADYTAKSEDRKSEIGYDILFRAGGNTQGYRSDGGGIRIDEQTHLVTVFFFEGALSDFLFNTSDLTPAEFAQRFIDSYGIPKLTPSLSYGQQAWRYESPQGWTLVITVKKVVDVAKSTNRKFD